MNEAQAIEMRDHLLDVDFALQEAIAAATHLPQADKELLIGLLNKVLEGLHCNALRLISDQHPQLGPPSNDPPMIVCDLRWKEVKLPPSVSEADLDAIIFSKLKPRPLKVARVLTDIWKVFEEEYYRSTMTLSAHASAGLPTSITSKASATCANGGTAR
jgi:hypothetical protein